MAKKPVKKIYKPVQPGAGAKLKKERMTPSQLSSHIFLQMTVEMAYGDYNGGKAEGIGKNLERQWKKAMGELQASRLVGKVKIPDYFAMEVDFELPEDLSLNDPD